MGSTNQPLGTPPDSLEPQHADAHKEFSIRAHARTRRVAVNTLISAAPTTLTCASLYSHRPYYADINTIFYSADGFYVGARPQTSCDYNDFD